MTEILSLVILIILALYFWPIILAILVLYGLYRLVRGATLLFLLGLNYIFIMPIQRVCRLLGLRQ
jgi:hypothetical protein